MTTPQPRVQNAYMNFFRAKIPMLREQNVPAWEHASRIKLAWDLMSTEERNIWNNQNMFGSSTCI